MFFQQRHAGFRYFWQRKWGVLTIVRDQVIARTDALSDEVAAHVMCPNPAVMLSVPTPVDPADVGPLATLCVPLVPRPGALTVSVMHFFQVSYLYHGFH